MFLNYGVLGREVLMKKDALDRLFSTPIQYSGDVFADWKRLHPEACPNCKTPWADMHPAVNIVPHFNDHCREYGWGR